MGLARLSLWLLEWRPLPDRPARPARLLAGIGGYRLRGRTAEGFAERHSAGGGREDCASRNLRISASHRSTRERPSVNVQTADCSGFGRGSHAFAAPLIKSSDAPLLHFAFGNILRRKLRTSLTLCGVAVGIAAFVALVGFSKVSFEREWLRVYESAGTDIVVIPRPF